MTNTTSPPSSARRLAVDQETARELVTSGKAGELEGLFSVARHVVAHGGSFSILPDPEVGGDLQTFRHPADLEEYIAEINLGRRSIGATEIPPRGPGSSN